MGPHYFRSLAWAIYHFQLPKKLVNPHKHVPMPPRAREWKCMRDVRKLKTTPPQIDDDVLARSLFSAGVEGMKGSFLT